MASFVMAACSSSSNSEVANENGGVVEDDALGLELLVGFDDVVGVTITFENVPMRSACSGGVKRTRMTLL